MVTNEALFEAAEKIQDATLRENATNFLKKMTEVIEGIGDRPIEWRPSSLKVVQSMSDTDKLPEGAKAGDIVIGDNILKGPVSVFPLRTWDSRVMWHEDTDRTDIICQSPDAKEGFKFGNCYKCEHSKFVEGEGTSCNKTKNFMVISSDLSDVFVCNFAKSQYAMGMDWEKAMRAMKVLPYKREYNLNVDNHPKYKKVKALTASPTRNAIPAEVEEFVALLFNRVKEDREQQLIAFKEYVENKSKGPQNALEDKTVGGDEGGLLLGSEGADDDSAVDDDSKSYQV